MAVILIDGDVFAYRAAFACEDEPEETAISTLTDLIKDAVEDVVYDPEDPMVEIVVYLTGKGNFRYDIAKTAVYKGNRKDAPKPRHLGPLRDFLEARWGAIVSEGEEADDLISKDAAQVDYNCVVISVDKDFLQLPCSIYNPVRKTLVKQTELEGMRFFYQQILEGDRADNIKGIHGVGPKKAQKMLQDCNSEEEMYDVAMEAYEGDRDRIVENGRLLWLRRFNDQMWEPPK